MFGNGSFVSLDNGSCVSVPTQPLCVTDAYTKAFAMLCHYSSLYYIKAESRRRYCSFFSSKTNWEIWLCLFAQLTASHSAKVHPFPPTTHRRLQPPPLMQPSQCCTCNGRERTGLRLRREIPVPKFCCVLRTWQWQRYPPTPGNRPYTTKYPDCRSIKYVINCFLFKH